MAAIESIEMLDDRDVRALQEHMDVYPDDPAAGPTEVAVYNRGQRYLVNPEAGWCSCDDVYYNNPEGGCKHQRRVAFERGDREIPSWANRAAIDRSIRPDHD